MSQTKVVLVVEDDVRVSQLLAKLMRLNGYGVVTAASVDQAVNTLTAAPSDIDLVTLDLHLPDRHGNELLDWLEMAAPDLPVVVITASAEELKPTNQVRAVFNKPFDVWQLVGKIAELSNLASLA